MSTSKHLGDLGRWCDARGLTRADQDELLSLVERWVYDAVSEVVSPTVAEQLIGHEPDMTPPAVEGPRYERGPLLGRGGMGEVYRAWDTNLRRWSAMKLLPEALRESPTRTAWFYAEARTTASLQHPGIVPIHDLGQLPDGEPYFTMKEIEGDSLHTMILETHATAPPDTTTLRRLVDVLRRVAEAVAYAHSRGVVHRDLKPANIMVGAFGEVMVLDWGVASAVAPPNPVPALDTADGHRRDAIVGAQPYMAPEQAQGAPVSRAFDVWALGTILAEILYGPHQRGARSVHEPDEAQDGDPLGALIARCRTPDPGTRLGDASLVAVALTQWLDGAHREERARALVEESERLAAASRELRRRQAVMASEAERLLDGVETWDAVDHKVEAWEHEEAAEALGREAARMESQQADLLQASLTYAADFAAAHQKLADLYRDKLEKAEEGPDPASAEEHFWFLKRHDRGAHRQFLSGEGHLTLETLPTGAEVHGFRYEERHRRLVPVPIGLLGTTPLREQRLQRGSYLIEIRSPGYDVVRYPVYIRRSEHWDGVPPDASTPHPIALPRSGQVSDDERYVPAGWTWSGTFRPGNYGREGRRAWVAGFCMRRRPVTHGEYLSFINDLVLRGQEEDALRLAPRERSGSAAQAGALCYQRDPSGLFSFRPDAEGDIWNPDWPAFLVTWHGARAFGVWLSEREGKGWRLPTELEWEKAARGVDRRIYPWGDQADEGFCNVRGSRRGRPLPASVYEFPEDESPYGVLGLAGNAREWCADLFATDDQSDIPDQKAERVIKGGAWFFPLSIARSDFRYALGPNNLGDTIGFRLARTWPTLRSDPE